MYEVCEADGDAEFPADIIALTRVPVLSPCQT